MINVKLKKMRDTAKLPTKATEGSAGYDLYAANVIDDGTDTIMYDNVNNIVFLYPGQTITITTGIGIELPIGYEAQIRSRSGLAIKHGLVVINSPGTIDSDYRGEILVGLKNTSNIMQGIKLGDRIAQMVFNEVHSANFDVVEELIETERGEGGLGSTGTSDLPNEHPQETTTETNSNTEPVNTENISESNN